MEHDTHVPGKHLAALQNIIEVHVGGVLKQLPPPEALSPANTAALLDFVCPIIDEYFARARYELYQECRTHADVRAQVVYLASRQYTLLELTGHLLQHTQPIQLFSRLSHCTLTDDICKHIYRRLDSLLNYTVVSLAAGQIDPALPVPPTACILYQHMLGSDLIALRERLVALHISPDLIDIVVQPFEALRHEDDVTFYTAVYLCALKQKLQEFAGGNQPSPGDGDVLRLLVAYNFNEPAFIAYCHQVMKGQLETTTSPDAHLRRLHDYKIRLAGLSYSTGLSLNPHQPSVCQQLTEWLGVVIAAPASMIPTDKAASAARIESDEQEDYDIPNGVPAADELMHYMHPGILGAIANAAHELRVIHLGNTDQQRAERIAQIPSSSKRVKAETILRAFNEEKACRKALLYVEELGNHFKAKIKKYEEKSSR
jgi:hypothetical protein